jgi:serine/threonine-protein phosphatase CPPED1
MKHRLVCILTSVVAGALLCLAQAQQPPQFVLLGDPQFGMYATNAGFVHETANYEFAVATVNRLKPGFVVILGDLVNKAGDPDQIGEFKRITAKLDPSIPVYLLPGNHDLGNEPTPETLAAFRRNLGRDYYSFRAGPVFGIVLDSPLIFAPGKAPREYQEQETWLRSELETAKSSGAKHIILFQHHPLFKKSMNETDDYENIPSERRQHLAELLRKYGVHYIFAGHTHRNLLARDGQFEVVATAPVGKPLGDDGSGIRVVAVSDIGLSHHYYEFGRLPDRLSHSDSPSQ